MNGNNPEIPKTWEQWKVEKEAKIAADIKAKEDLKKWEKEQRDANKPLDKTQSPNIPTPATKAAIRKLKNDPDRWSWTNGDKD